MKSRALKFKLLCGLEGCIPLDPTDLSEVGSAAEFISIVDKFRTGIRRFNDRNPNITWSPSPSLREDTTLNDIIHDIVNSRKFMNFPNVEPNDYEQVFELNFATETITLYAMRPEAYPAVELEELGSMHINTMFSNWKDLFYYGVEEDDITFKEDEDFDESDIEIINEEESLYEYMKPKMRGELGDKQMELWDLLMSNLAETDLPENCTFKVNYSGSGDSGDIDSFNVYYDKDGSYVSDRIESHFNSDISNQMYSQAWRVIDEEEPGFVNNDGGYGEMQISASKFSWEHYNYYTETNQTIGMDIDFSEDEGKLPSEIEDSMEATAPGTKADTTLLDIVKEYHPEKVSITIDLNSMFEGSDFDFDKITTTDLGSMFEKSDSDVDKIRTTDRKPPEIPF
jgi:hypothetical protein